MSWPFNSFDAPDYLDGTLAGDAGFVTKLTSLLGTYLLTKI